MPREVWSIEIQADISKALGQLQSLRSQLATLGSGATAIRPVFDASGVQKGVKTMNTALSSGQRRATGFISGLQQDFGNFGRIFASRIAFTFATAVERLIIGSLLLIPKAFAGAISAGAQFEDALRRTATVAAGGFGDIEGAMDKLGKTAREVGATTTFTAVEVASAMFELVSVGLSVEETQDAITASAELAVAVQTDLGTAIDITTQIMKAFGLNASELADIGDKLTFAIDNTTLNVSRLQAALRFAAPAAGALGIEFDDMLTVIAKFVDVTKQGGIAGRAFRFMISALADPSAKAKDRIESLGLTVEDVDPQMNSLTDIMKKFAFTTLDGGDALAIFGKRAGGTVAGAITDIRLGLAAGVDELEKFKEGLTEAARLDLAKKQAQEFMQTLVSQWKIFVSKITELGLQIFDVIGPGVIIAAKAVNGFLDVVIKIGPALQVFLSLLISISAVRIAGALGAGTIALIKFTRATIAANRAGTLFAAGSFASNRAMVVAARNSGIAAGSMTKFTVIISRIIPFLTKFAGRAGLIGVATGFILWVKNSALLNETLKFLGNLLVSMIPQFDSLDKLMEFLNKKWLFMKDMLSVIINQGFDIFISTLIGLFGKLVGGIADVLSGLGLLDESNSTLRNLESAAEDAAQHVLDLSAASENARIAALRMEDAVLTLNEALKIQINSLDDFRTKEAAVVQSFNQLTAAGETQERALFLLQDALRDLFLNSELVSGEYSKSLIPLMAEAEVRFKFTGDAAGDAAEKMKKLNDAFSAIFGTNAPETRDALNEVFDAIIAVEEGAGRLTDGQMLALVERLDELEKAAKDAGVEMGSGLAARIQLARLTIQGMTGDVQVLAVTANDASKMIGKLPEAITAMDPGFPTFKALSDAIKEISDKFDTARILISGGFAPPGVIEGIKTEFAEVAQSLVDVEAFAGQSSDEFLSMAANLGFVRKEGESVELFTRRIAASAKDADSAYADFFKNVRQGIATALGELIVKGKNFGTTMKKLFDGVFVTNLTKGIENSLGAFDTLREGGASTMDSLKGGVEEFRKTLDGPLNAAIIGARAAMGGWQDVGMAAMSAISNFAKGDWIAGIMASIGAVAGALKNLFGGTTAQKEMKKLGISVSDNLIKTIEEAEKKLGDYGAAIRTNLAAIIKEEGIPNIAMLNKFLGMQTALLSDLDRGTISSKQAMEAMNASMTELMASAVDLNSPQGFAGIITTLTDVIKRTTLTGASMINTRDAVKLLNDQFPALVEASKEFGVAGLEGMRSLIEGARAAGLEVEALNSFVIEKASTIVSSIQSLVGSGMALTAQQVQFAARAMSVAFAELRASGMTIPEIIDQMGDSIVALRDRATELGIKLPASFNLIVGLGALFKNEFVKPQLDGLNAIQSAFQAMIELGLKPTQQDFNVLKDQANKAFQTMIDQGFKGKKALLAIAPTLELIRDNAADFGLTIDANTQSLIDQATEQGVLGAQTMSDTDVMKTGFDNIGKAINRLIETMGGVPVALKTFGDEVVTQGGKMQNEFVKTGAVLQNEVVAGIITAQDAISNLGSTASNQMQQFRDSASNAVSGAIDDFQFLQQKLVGNTIIKDIADLGSGFMQDWGDFTHNVVLKVGDDFERLETRIGPDSEADRRRQGLFGIPKGLLDRGASGFHVPDSLSAGDIRRKLRNKDFGSEGERRALDRALDRRLSLRIDLGGRELKNFIVDTMEEESRNGRARIAESAIREGDR